MPRLAPLAKLIALAAVPFAGALAGVLYGMSHGDVHAPGISSIAPPAALLPFAREEKPAEAPAAAFADGQGKRHSLSEYRGGYVLLNLWATWCAPCVKELPGLAKLKAQTPGLSVVAVDATGHSETAAEAAAFLRSHKAGSLGAYVDRDMALIAAFHAYGLPFTVLIDPSGKMIAKAEGPADWSGPQSLAYFRSLVQNPPS